jgi:hypothetical protein
MIQDLDETLKDLLVRKVPLDLAAVDVRFEMPTKDWAAAVQRPTVNLYLYDLRENLELRSNERYVERQGASGLEHRAPVRLDLTYLITVWTTEVDDEHRLLGTLLATLLRYPQLPAEVLKGAMQEQALPLRAWIAQPERTPNAWDFWGSLDGRLKAGISYVVTTAWEPVPAEARGLVTQSEVRLCDRVPRGAGS